MLTALILFLKSMLTFPKNIPSCLMAFFIRNHYKVNDSTGLVTAISSRHIVDFVNTWTLILLLHAKSIICLFKVFFPHDIMWTLLIFGISKINP